MTFRLLTIVFITIFLVTNNSFSQVSSELDTLIIETVQQKGHGPLSYGVSIIKNNPNVRHFIKGIPDTLDKIMVNAYSMDYRQEIYQGYYMDRVSQKRFDKLMSWNPDTTKLSKELVNVYVPIAAGFNKKGKKVVVVDQNHNLDLSDDKPFTIPPPNRIDNIFERYNDSLLVQVKFDYFDGQKINSKTTWIYLDHSYQNSNTDPIELTFSVLEYRVGEFSLFGKNYKIALHNNNNEGVYTSSNSSLVLLSDNSEKRIPSKYNIKHNQFINLDSHFYRFSDVSKNGKYITLIKDDDIINRGFTQIGLKTIDFSATTLDEKRIKPSDFKGKFIYLEFYMINCPHCQNSIRNLNQLYSKYQSKGFEFIGILDEGPITITEAKKFVEEKNIKWPQILNGYQTNPNLSKIYPVDSYPTAFIIDPDGVIIDKYVGAMGLEETENILIKLQQK